MSIALSRRERRTLLLGVGIVVGLVAVAKVLPAWREWSAEARASAAETLAEAERAERSVRALGALDHMLVARNARYLALAERIVPGDGPAAAVSELATFLSGTAAAADLSVGAMQVRTDTTAGSAFARVSVLGDVVGDVRGLTRFLAEIERGPLLLSVRELAITQSEPAASADRPEILRVQFAIEGIALRRRTPDDSQKESPVHAELEDGS